MLYRYKDKIVVNPAVNRIVEVKVQKKGNDYDVTLTKNKIIQSNIARELTKIDIEEAYKLQQKRSKDNLENEDTFRTTLEE